MSLDISLIPQERIKDLISTLDNIQSNINNIGTDLTNNLVHKTGNETITGQKTLTASNIITNHTHIRNENVEQLTVPSGYSERMIHATDMNGVRIGSLGFAITADGSSRTYIESSKVIDGTARYGLIESYTDLNGNHSYYIGGNLVKAFVKETYNSGTDWYRVWSDGWIEQGGKFVITNASIGSGGYNTATLTFIKPFTKCITYNVQAKHDRFNAGFSTEVNGQALSQVEVYQVNDSTGSFVNPFVIWTACGY